MGKKRLARAGPWTQSVSPETMSAEAGLSRREAEIFDLLLKGLSNTQIAANLHLAKETVKTHVSQVFKKLGAKSRLRLIAKVMQARTAICRRIDRVIRRWLGVGSLSGEVGGEYGSIHLAVASNFVGLLYQPPPHPKTFH